MMSGVIISTTSARRCVRLAASLAIVGFSAACAVDVTDYTPFGGSGGNTQVALRDRDAGPLTTASIPRRTPAPAKVARSKPASPATVIVARGDTLYSLARRHRTSVDRIAAANAIGRPFMIKAGQRLTVPGATSDRVQAVAPAAADPVHTGSIRQSRQAPVHGGVRVAAGDTLYSIARHNRVNVEDLMVANEIRRPGQIATGQVLMLPYQRIASGTTQSAGYIGVRAMTPVPAKVDRRSEAQAAYAKVMRDYRVVPGQSILAPF